MLMRQTKFHALIDKDEELKASRIWTTCDPELQRLLVDYQVRNEGSRLTMPDQNSQRRSGRILSAGHPHAHDCNVLWIDT